jgi:hypothetical protein
MNSQFFGGNKFKKNIPCHGMALQSHGKYRFMFANILFHKYETSFIYLRIFVVYIWESLLYIFGSCFIYLEFALYIWKLLYIFVICFIYMWSLLYIYLEVALYICNLFYIFGSCFIYLEFALYIWNIYYIFECLMILSILARHI